jgi:NADP-dependent 3-hydroxy acid dehydrogenase YdfG
MRLKDKVAIVTGGAQGIGRAVALGMGREGANVAVADLQGEKAQSVAGELHALGAQALAVEVNVASESAVTRMAKEVFGRFGRADILVNVAGIYFPKAPVVDLSEQDWDRTMDINVGSNFLCCREFVPSMRAQKSGRIICLASGIGHYGMRQFSHYAASKAAVMGFVKALARELPSMPFAPVRQIPPCLASTVPKKRSWSGCVRRRCPMCSNPRTLPGQSCFSPATPRVTSPASLIILIAAAICFNFRSKFKVQCFGLAKCDSTK